MKILIICAEGNIRSVTTRYVLNGLGNFDILACGIDRNKPETIKMLCEWADMILLAEKRMADKLPLEYINKVNQQFEIGPDRWGNYPNPDLINVIKEQLKKINFSV